MIFDKYYRIVQSQKGVKQRQAVLRDLKLEIAKA